MKLIINKQNLSRASVRTGKLIMPLVRSLSFGYVSATLGVNYVS
jgi:hypothetical protein